MLLRAKQIKRVAYTRSGRNYHMSTLAFPHTNNRSKHIPLPTSKILLIFFAHQHLFTHDRRNTDGHNFSLLKWDNIQLAFAT